MAESSARAWTRRGVAPSRLLSQVESTARWALEGKAESWQAWLREAPLIESIWTERAARNEYLRVMIAAHFTTVATFVPTDVDAHIRHHIWQEIESSEELASALAIVEEAARWDPRPVSARVLEVPGVGRVAGHEGEWFSVRAGALGRALAIGAGDIADEIVAAIDRELVREAEAIAAARAGREPVLALSIATTSAHNCGDLSRVIEAWPKAIPRRDELFARFARLGHEGPERYQGQHHWAGHVNKEVMASENHRHLALRGPRALRRSRGLIVPIGPFFDAWGETIGRSPLLEEKDRGEILAALVHALDAGVDRWGYHRAVAGMHRAAPGGIDRLVGYLPARLRPQVQKGPLRDALRVEPAHFVARMENAYARAVASYRRGG